ncbi:MAG: Fic family protein [Nitrospirota bacterium]
MKKRGRYDVLHLTEAQFEPGSRMRVLKNRLGVTRKREMDRIERRELARTLEQLYEIYDRKHRFTVNDIKHIHKIWLGNIYEWAGEYRQVNLSKGGFSFAASAQIPLLMKEVERGPLRKFTPCIYNSHDRLAEALAVVHTELVLIHPFREGNGRIARILSSLMAIQAGLPPLDFRGVTGKKKKEYIIAVQAGMDRNYKPMEKMFKYVIRRTLRIRGQAM